MFFFCCWGKPDHVFDDKIREKKIQTEKLSNFKLSQRIQ